MNLLLLITTLVALAIAAPQPDCNCKHSGSLEFNSGPSSFSGSSNEPSINVPYSQPQPPNRYHYSAENSASLNPGASYAQSSSSVNQRDPNYNFGLGDSALGNSASYGQSSSSDSSANQENNNYNFGLGDSTLGNGASDGQSLSSSGGSSFTSDSSANQGNSNYNFGSVNSDSVVTNAEASVTKQLYFFEAPHDDDEVVKARYDLPPSPPKKAFKIIFIKAPTYNTQATITIPAPPQNDEKTLVYVLVKKPETNAKVQIKEAAPSQPTKPEVFFIKYKTQNEAQDAIAQIQGKYGATGQVIANLPAGSQAAFQSPDGHIVQKPQFVNVNSVNGVVDGNNGASQNSEAISSSNVIPQSSPSYVSIGQSYGEGANTAGVAASQSPTYVSALGQSFGGGDDATYSSQNSDKNGYSGSAGVSYQVSNGGGQQEGSGVIVSGAEGASTTDSSNCDH